MSNSRTDTPLILSDLKSKLAEKKSALITLATTYCKSADAALPKNISLIINLSEAADTIHGWVETFQDLATPRNFDNDDLSSFLDETLHSLRLCTENLTAQVTALVRTFPEPQKGQACALANAIRFNAEASLSFLGEVKYEALAQFRENTQNSSASLMKKN